MISRPILMYLLIGTCLLQACGPNNLWTFERDIQLTDISPNGIAILEGEIWISDTDNNRLVKINDQGDIVGQIHELDRPMHISETGGQLLVPEYGSDIVAKIIQGQIDTIKIKSIPDAPASVDMSDGKVIIADFYNHRVIYEAAGEINNFGEKGKIDGQFHYPTDVQFFEDKLYVADAYNHRIQVFDKNAQHLATIGSEDGMNATTGMFVNKDFVVATDFENDRVLTYAHSGELLDIMDEGFLRPTDVLISDEKLYVLNYKGKFISIFNR